MAWIWTLSLNGILGLAGYFAARRVFRQPPGFPRALAAATLAWAWAILGLQILGALGRLRRESLMAWAVTGLLIALAFRGRTRDEQQSSRKEPGWDAPAVLALGLTLWACLLIGVTSLLMPVRVISDGPIYHLYFAVRWWKAGRVFPIATPFGESAATYFPANGSLWFTWLLAGRGDDRLARVGQAPFGLLAVVASYAMARRLGAGSSAALIAVCWFVTSLPMLLFSFESNVDTIFVAGYLVAAYFLLRYALRDGGAGSLALAGLAAGGALGTKPTAVVFVPVLLAAGGLAILARRGTSRWGRVGHLAILGLTPLILSGYWYGRNVLMTGNPLYPAHLSLFGRVILPGGYPPAAMARGEFHIPVGRWDALLDTLTTVADARLLLFWIAAILGAWAIGRARTEAPRRWAWACSALAVANVALYWIAIPYRSQQRFLLQALGLAVVPLALVLDRSRWIRWAGAALLAIHLGTPQTWPFDVRVSGRMIDELPAMIALPGSRRELTAALSDPAATLYLIGRLGIGVGAIMLATAWASTTRRKGRGPILVALTGSVGLVGLAVVILGALSGATDLFYPGSREYGPAWAALEAVSARDGSRVAYAGTNMPYYLFAKGLRNEVRYVNIDGHPDWLLHDYQELARRRGDPALWDSPRPGWDRIYPDGRGWLENLRDSGIDLLVVARPRPEDGTFNMVGADPFPLERAWADARPDLFPPVYGVSPPDPRMKIYRVRLRGVPSDRADRRNGSDP